jgi:alkylated DNA repair dioxygenase AlkB
MSLFSLADTPTFDPRFTGLRRIELSPGAWIDHVAQWLRGDALVFESLRTSIRWHEDERKMYDRIVDVPRLTAILPEDGEDPSILRDIAAALSARYAECFDRISLAYYRDGRDSVAWHGDRVLRDRQGDSLVATVSVGEPRRFLLRPTGGGRSIAFSCGWGDLLVMGGSCQRTWQHSVPKAAQAGPRMSIMFRCSAYRSAV